VNVTDCVHEAGLLLDSSNPNFKILQETHKGQFLKTHGSTGV